MVGHKFIEALKEKDPSNNFNVVTFCEESRAAYNRMRLTEVRGGHSIDPSAYVLYAVDCKYDCRGTVLHEEARINRWPQHDGGIQP